MIVFYSNGFRYYIGEFSNGKPKLSPPFKSMKELFEHKAKANNKPLSHYKFHNLDFTRMKDSY